MLLLALVLAFLLLSFLDDEEKQFWAEVRRVGRHPRLRMLALIALPPLSVACGSDSGITLVDAPADYAISECASLQSMSVSPDSSGPTGYGATVTVVYSSGNACQADVAWTWNGLSCSLGAGNGCWPTYTNGLAWRVNVPAPGKVSACVESKCAEMEV